LNAPTLLPPVSVSCRNRLTGHYGSAVDGWLDHLPRLFATASRQWNLTLIGYHDAGHASALATAIDRQGHAVLLKAWPDPNRYVREVAALRLWHPGPGRIVLAADDALSTAVLRVIGPQPGGDEPPADEATLVAEAVQQAHSIGRSVPKGVFPPLSDHLRDTVMPRVRERRAATTYAHLAARITPHVSGLAEDPRRRTILHADLYRENVAFTRQGRPVLLDPLPMRGDALFDWAFWILYYRLGYGTQERLRQAASRSGVRRPHILPWCLLIGLDGLLFYEESGDPRAERMATVLDALCSQAEGGHAT
jgi:streptomycin 6-kinase